MTVLIATIFECVACGQRYPLMPYYPAAAPHGPNRDCTAPLGWMKVNEPWPPTSRPPASARATDR